MNRTMNGPIATRSALRMSGTKTENRVAAWASNRHFRASSQSRFAYQSWSLGSMVSRSRGRVPRSDSILAVHRRTTPPIVWVDQPGFRLLPASAPARTRATSRRVVQCTLAVLWSVPDRSARSGSATQEPGGDGPSCSARTTPPERARDGDGSGSESSPGTRAESNQSAAPCGHWPWVLQSASWSLRHLPPERQRRSCRRTWRRDRGPGSERRLQPRLAPNSPRLLTHPDRVRPFCDREPDHPSGGQLHI